MPTIGFAKNKAGCCLVLRGGTRKELAKVKCVMKQFLLLKTHATFEKAFLLDEPSQVHFPYYSYYYTLSVPSFCVHFRFLSFLLNRVWPSYSTAYFLATNFVKLQHSVLKFLIENFFSQVDNFIVPDYKNCHLTQLCLSPFVEIPLPDHDLIKAINADCDAIEDQNDCDETDTIDTTPTIAKTVPLILTTTLQVILCQINMFCHQITQKYYD